MNIFFFLYANSIFFFSFFLIESFVCEILTFTYFLDFLLPVLKFYIIVLNFQSYILTFPYRLYIFQTFSIVTVNYRKNSAAFYTFAEECQFENIVSLIVLEIKIQQYVRK